MVIQIQTAGMSLIHLPSGPSNMFPDNHASRDPLHISRRRRLHLRVHAVLPLPAMAHHHRTTRVAME